ncbi:RES family NAD+ phosphorylase [Reichenbachiella ulvae]|uniref:RES family NAD+ phosphorylase n=1 Tax=Reichenbachiella ulvae TaxID=2980104 RepID=A0ABT3CUB4_9BACT|nr:RES family NAD+ phosphorylase [Reichenbachiella ulvae]MCV9387281.1 RES family NAD+ phosphorylase [Reichenbachiella ulvae]
MRVYRICQTYPPDHDPLDGRGAFLNGGRWNHKGSYAVYTASSLALARAELARHVNLECIPDNFRVYEIEIPDHHHRTIDPIPDGWNADPEDSETKKIGSELLKNPDILCLKVPSICDPDSFNYILNPTYKDFSEVQIIKHYPFTP